MIIEKLCKQGFYLQAYADYLKSASTNWSLLQELVLRLIDECNVDALFPEGDIPENPNFVAASKAQEVYDAFLSERTDWIPDVEIPLINNIRVPGYLLCQQLAGKLVFSELWSSGDFAYDVDPMDAPLFPAYPNMSGNDVLRHIAGTGQATDVAAAIIEASQLVSPADRIAVFQNTIEQKWGALSADASALRSLGVEVLGKANVTANDIAGTLYDTMGIDELADPQSPTLITDTDFSQYTGASPVPALDFSQTKTVVVTATKTAWAGIKAVFNLAKKAVVKVSTKVKQFAVETFVDPYDLYVNGEGSPCVDEWAIPLTASVKARYLLASDKRVSEFIADRSGKIDVCRTIFGDIAFQLKDATPIDGGIGHICRYSGAYKPLLLNPVVVDSLLAKHGLSIRLESDVNDWLFFRILGPTDLENALAVLSELQANVGALYGDVKQLTEQQACLGFAYACLLMQAFVSAALKEHEYGADSTQMADVFGFASRWYCPAFPDLSGRITNADFAYLTAGHTTKLINGATPPPLFSPFELYYEPVYQPGIDGWGLSQAMATLFLEHKWAQVTDPIGFDFFPYLQVKESVFEPGALSVKTDAQNSDLASKVVTAIAFIAIVATVAVTGFVVAKKLSRRLYQKAYARKAALDSKLWSGEQLSKKEWKQMKRAEKRIARAGLVAPGPENTQDGSSSSSSNSHSDSISKILMLIGGASD